MVKCFWRDRRTFLPVMLVSWFLCAAAALHIAISSEGDQLRGHMLPQVIAICALFAASDIALFAGQTIARLPVFPAKLFCVYFMTESTAFDVLSLSCIIFCLIFECWFFLRIMPASITSAVAAFIVLRTMPVQSAWNFTRPGMTRAEFAVVLLVACAAAVAGKFCASALEKSVRQDSDIRRLEETVSNLTETNTAFQTYATYIEETSREEERHRISREIHDIVGYSMTNLLMIVQAALYSEDQDQVTGLLQKAQIHINESLEEIRLALRKLRSTQKKTLHGTELIRFLTDNFQKLSGIDIKLDFISFPVSITVQTEETLYRMIQESMTNSFRHGKATSITMSFWTSGDILVVQIRDNGKKRPENPEGEGIGLKGMHERIAETGGTLSTETAVDGFTVLARIPLEQPVADGPKTQEQKMQNDQPGKTDGNIRLLLVDDQYLFLESLKLVLTSLAPDFTIAGTAQNGDEAVRLLETTQIDIVLMDVYMPVMDGVAAVKVITSRHPEVSVIMLTTFEDDDYVTEALAHGAKGYLLKNIAPQMLINAVRAVWTGSVLIAPNIASSLIQHLKDKTSPGHGPITLPDWFYELSSKERTIIKLIIRGFSNKEIAAEINVGEQTIRNYVSTIYDKLEVTCRKDAIRVTRDLPPFYLD